MVVEKRDTVKLQLRCNNKLWKEVRKFKIDQDLKDNNEAVIELIKRGLRNG